MSHGKSYILVMEWQIWQMMVIYYLNQKGNLLSTFPNQYYIFLSCAEK